MKEISAFDPFNALRKTERNKMGKSNKAPDYASTTTNTGLYGSSTTNRNGTTFNPSAFQSTLINNVQNQLPNTINEYINPTYSSPEYQLQQAQRYNNYAQSYDAGVLGDIANRGLTRSSGLQAATNQFSNQIAQNEAQALQDYRDTQGNDINTLMGLYQVPYGMMTGTNGASQNLSSAVSNYNLMRYNSQGNSMLSNMIKGGLQGAGSAALSSGFNPWATAAGGVIGAAGGAMEGA